MTAEELRVAWTKRDELYALRRVRVGLHEITESMAEGIRLWRMKEAAEVEPRERGSMIREAAAWSLPEGRR